MAELWLLRPPLPMPSEGTNYLARTLRNTFFSSLAKKRQFALFPKLGREGFGFPFPIVLAFILRVCARKGSSVHVGRGRGKRGRIKDSAVPKTEREGEWEGRGGEGRGGEKKQLQHSSRRLPLLLLL